MTYSTDLRRISNAVSRRDFLRLTEISAGWTFLSLAGGA